MVGYDYFLAISMSNICQYVVADIQYLPILLTFKIKSKAHSNIVRFLNSATAKKY